MLVSSLILIEPFNLVAQVICQEAVKTGQLRVAAKALSKLHSQLVTLSSDKISEATRGTLTEASCLRALIICLGPQDSKKEGPICADHTELAGVFKLVASRYCLNEDSKAWIPYSPSPPAMCSTSNRAEILGHSAFFGEEMDKNIGLDWFIGKAWISALAAADSGDMGSCTTILTSYVSLLKSHPAARSKHAQASHKQQKLLCGRAI